MHLVSRPPCGLGPLSTKSHKLQLASSAVCLPSHSSSVLTVQSHHGVLAYHWKDADLRMSHRPAPRCTVNYIAMLNPSANDLESSLLIHEWRKEWHGTGDVVIGNQHPFFSYHNVFFKPASSHAIGGHETESQNSYFLVEWNLTGQHSTAQWDHHSFLSIFYFRQAQVWSCGRVIKWISQESLLKRWRSSLPGCLPVPLTLTSRILYFLESSLRTLQMPFEVSQSYA